jgi:hypothetical protein
MAVREFDKKISYCNFMKKLSSIISLIILLVVGLIACVEETRVLMA